MRELALVAATAIAIVVILVLAFGGDDKEWQEFKVAHHCKVVGHVKGGSGVSSRGSVVWMNDQTTWLCDDGLTYTRDDE